MILSSTAPIQNNSNHTNPQSGESQSELNIDTLVFNCRRVRNVEEVRQILPSLINIFPGFSEKQVRHFQEEVIPQLLRFAEIDEQQELSLMLANWYVTNQSAENRLFSALQAMHYFAKSIQIGIFRNYSLQQLHQKASQLFLRIIDDQHQEKVQKTLNTLANVTSEDLHAFEIFEHHIDQFHCLPHFCTQLKDFDVIKTLFTIATKSLNTVPLERLEKYSGSSEKIAKGLKLTYALPTQHITEKYWEAIATYRSVFGTIDFSNGLTVEEIRNFQGHATECFRAFFKLLIDDALILLGPPPSLYQRRLHQPPCCFEILAMGSLGRKEVCPYSDLEFMIIIENKEASEYFKRLVQVLEIQIASLGETSTDNPVFTCIHQKNPSGLHIDSSPSLNPKLIQTPTAMAQLQINPITEFQTIEYTALRTTSLYASESAHSLFDSYQMALAESLESCREERASKFFARHYADYQENWKQPFNPNQGIVNIKKQFVVPLYHLLGDMAFYFGIPETNTLDIIEELVKRECFTQESGKLLQECVAVLYAMRMRLHLFYREQKEEASCSSDLKFLTLSKNEIALLEKTFWLVLQPLYGCLGSILKKLETDDTSAKDFKTLFKNIDLIPIAFQDKFFNLSKPLVKQIALHYCQIKAPLETHLYYFRTLSKQPQELLRECYFNVLEKNLNQEDKPNILQILLDMPNQSGLRLAFSRELKELEATLTGMTDKLQDGNEMVVMTTTSSTIPRYLKSSIVKKILDGVDIRKMYRGSAHEVCRLEYEGHDLHFKQKPSHPLMEYAIHNLTSRIAGKLTPPNFLVRFDVYTVQGQKSYPVLISKTIPGKNLTEEWKKVKPNASYTWNLLCSILTRPGDGRFENYILNDQLNIFCVDNDYSFVELASNHFFSKNQFCSALFSILKLDTPLDSAVLKEFASLDSYSIILGWIEDVILKEKEYKALFRKEGEIERLFTEDENNTFTPAILFQKGALANLHLQFWSLQNAIRQAFDQGKTMTSGSLLQELVDLKNDSIGTIVHKAYNNHNLPDAKERLKKSTSRTSEKSLTSIQYHDALGIKPSFKQIKKGEYSPEEAKEEFLATALNSESRYATVKENQNSITIQAQFKRLNNDPVREEKVLQALTQKFKRMAKHIPITLIFNDSHIMTSDFLAPFLHENVEHLELTNCPTLKNDTINLIQEKCPKLQSISLTGCANITEIRGTYWSPLLNFAKLEELDVGDCSHLQSLKLDAPLLKTLRFKNCPNLKTFETKAIFLLALKEDFPAFLDFRSRFWKDLDVVLAAVKQHDAALQYADESLKKNRDFVLDAVKKNGLALQYADASFKKDKTIVLAAVKQNGSAFQYADASFKKDKNFVFTALQDDKGFASGRRDRNGRLLLNDVSTTRKDTINSIKQKRKIFKHIDKSLKKDRDFILDAITKYGIKPFKYADESLKKDKEFALIAVKQTGGGALKYADEDLKKDKDVVLAAVRLESLVLQYADESLKKDKEVVLAAVRKYGLALEYGDATLKKDTDVVLAAVTQNGLALQYADESFKKDYEFVLAAVKQDGWVLQHADESLKKDKDVVLAAVTKYGLALEYADESLKKDKDVVLTAFKQNITALQYANHSLKKDKDFMLIAVMQDVHRALQYADESLMKDKDFILAAVTRGGWVLQHVDESFKKDKDVVLAAVKREGLALQYADESLMKDKEVVLAAVKRDGLALQYADESLMKDKEVVLAAVKKSGLALQYANHSLKKDKDFMLIAVIKDIHRALQYADESLMKDKDFILAAVTQGGWVLQHADESLKKGKDVVLAAVKKSGLALEHADGTLKKDADVVLAAVTQNGLALQYADESLKKDYEVVLAAVTQDGCALKYADASLKKNTYVVLAAVTRNGLALQYADESLKKDKDVVLIAVKQNGLVLQDADASLKKDADVVLAAVKQHRLAFQYAHHSIKDEVMREMNEKVTTDFHRIG